MSSTVFDSAIYGPLLSDEEVAAHFSDEAQLAAMVRFEAALARAEEAVGVIPAGTADQLAAVDTASWRDLSGFGLATAQIGHPVSALVRRLREEVGVAGDYVHWGATAQDVTDTGLVLRLREVLGILDNRLRQMIAALDGHAKAHPDTVMAARTRGQHAVPTTFGFKVEGWIAPLLRHLERLDELKPRLFVLQFGGAAGTLSALGDNAEAVSEKLASELDLTVPPTPWHTQRDSFCELAGWFSLVTGTMGKIGQDLVLMSQNEIGELNDGSQGGSSTMPHKSNPVLSELLVTAARTNAGLLSGMHQSSMQEHERGGSGWTMEWILLPQMAVITAAALRYATQIATGLTVNPDNMSRNLEATNGLVMAEAAVFALAVHMPRPRAQELVKKASQEVVHSGKHLCEVLPTLTDAPVAWDKLRDPRNYLGLAAHPQDDY